MTQPARVFDSRTLLAQLLDEQFSDGEVSRALAPDPPIPWKLWQEALYSPLSDFVARPGKDTRSRIVEACWVIAGGGGVVPVELPAIVESLHAGSLIIDDIEDGSTHRRGAPALHATFGVPGAMNAGCWLYFWPHALLERLQLPPALELAARRRIGEALLACHSGQALDLGVRIFTVDQADVPRVVRAVSRLKTGGLAEAAAALGAIAAGGRSDTVAAVAAFGRELGVTLQMLDDLGGILRVDRCHKGHEDLRLARATWPFAWVARELPSGDYARLAAMSAEVHARDLHPEYLAEALRAHLGDDPVRAARTHFAEAMERLEVVCGRQSATAELRSLIADLERAYV